jgi:hypothetical protein
MHIRHMIHDMMTHDDEMTLSYRCMCLKKHCVACLDWVPGLRACNSKQNNLNLNSWREAITSYMIQYVCMFPSSNPICQYFSASPFSSISCLSACCYYLLFIITCIIFIVDGSERNQKSKSKVKAS